MISEEPADLQATIEQTDSGEQQYVLRALCDHLSGIREELSGIRTLLEAGHAASEAMRGQAQAYLEAQQARTQEYLEQVQIEPEPDFYPFVELPAAFRQLQAALLKQPGGDREMVEVLALVLHHDEQAVLTAVELALGAGVPTKMHVLNVLHRLLDSKAPPPPVTAPQALRLVREPLANVTRYDDLRASERKVRHAS